MENLWKVETKEEYHSPYLYIKEQCDYLSESTYGKVIGRIKEYDGEYRSVSAVTATYNVFSNPFMMQEEPVSFDVQKELGDKNSKFVYEFYITSKSNPSYKYRIMFLAYGISIYPTYISLEKTLADEIACSTEFTINSEDEFKGFLGKVLGSEGVSNVISSLLSFEKV